MGALEQSSEPADGSEAAQGLLNNGSTANQTSPIWQAAVERYNAELRKGGIRRPSIDKELWNIQKADDLLREIRKLASAGDSARENWAWVSQRLEPILLNLNDFASIVVLSMGMNDQAAALIWGSIKLIFRVG